MAETYDLIVIGGGHNGLAVAAYLARAGQRVIVLEHGERVGGGLSTEEVTLPGFKHNLHSQGHREGPVNRTLELEKHGLRYVRPDPNYSMVFEDGSSLCLYKDLERTVENIAQFSKHDAVAYRKLFDKFKHLRQIVLSSWYMPPLPLSKTYQVFEGTEDGRLFLYILNSSPMSVMDAFFEHPRVKAWALLMSMQGSIAPDAFGMGALIPLLFVGMHDHPYGVCVGGSWEMARAMQACLEEAGGTVRTGARVRKILLEQGEARAVLLEDGTEIRAKKAIASNTNVRMTMLDLVGEEHLEADFARGVRAFEGDELALLTVHYALDEAPRFVAAQGNPDVARCWLIAWGVENPRHIQEIVNDIRARTLPRRILGFGGSPTANDPSQAPPGKHTAFIWTFVPYHLPQGPESWPRVQEAYADAIQAAWRAYAPNMTGDAILGRYVYTPRDIELKVPSMFHGSIQHGHAGPNQLGPFRPVPGWANYRMPIKKLYLCGSSAHPMGGIAGAPGFNAAGVICDDLGLKKWWWRSREERRKG
ncbi:MAG: NAD(P)/FAD-dependent oxidoreductase [Candidatus Tectomicrobia bacterium]|nr:NAD(P)/FAD-dependent oxidoreductase [Candidatus Tectomicrobia bacterium]